MPNVPPTLTIRPDRAAIIAGRTARIVLNTPRMLRWMISSNSASVVSTPVLPIGPDPPATLTRMSIAP